jgi:hypothetical protein
MKSRVTTRVCVYWHGGSFFPSAGKQLAVEITGLNLARTRNCVLNIHFTTQPRTGTLSSRSRMLLRPFARQRQVLGTPSTRKPVQILRTNILQDGTPVRFANDHADQLGMRDYAHPNGIVHQVKEVMLADATSDPLCHVTCVLKNSPTDRHQPLIGGTYSS